MNRQKTLRTKNIVHLVVHLILLAIIGVLLYKIGKPAQIAVQSGGDVRLDPGGFLAQIRNQEGLTESQIGEIDPASNTIKLTTFGLRGVAIALLWHRSQEYQKRLDWNNVIATSNQLVFLEPHFTPIWEFLGWNLSYNASAEFDDYRERYRWVIRGIDFLTRGVEFNRQAPKLCKATGWTISQKIGIADENQQYRRLLREDEEFGTRHDCPLPSDRDNWMLGRRWYHQGEDLVLRGISIGNESDFLFFSNSRLNLFNYAKWKRKDGIFGEEAIRAWENAGAEWREFSKLVLSTAIPEDNSLRMRPGVKAKRTSLETTDLVREEAKNLLQDLNAFVPELKRNLCIDRWKQLAETKGQQGVLLNTLETAFERPSKYSSLPHEELRIIREWLDANEPDWKTRLQTDWDSLYTEEQLELKKIPVLLLEEDQRDILNKADGAIGQVRERAFEILRVTPKVLSQEIQELDVSQDAKRRARAITAEIDGHKERTRMADLYRDILNFEYRLHEVAVERTQQADDAQRFRYFGRIAYYDGRIADSIKGWLDAMKKWEELYELPDFEYIAEDGQFIREIIDIVEKFVIILDNDNKIFSDVAEDKVPMHAMIRNKLNQENNPEQVILALEYAKKEFEKSLTEKEETKRNEILEKVEKYFQIISQRFDGINMSIEFMKLGPLFDIRDYMIESNAYYVKTLQNLGKPLPEPLPLRSFVELMMKHDPAIGKATTAIETGLPSIRNKNYAEAQTEFEKAIELWEPILNKYPIIPLDPTLQIHADIALLTGLYADTLKAQKKTIPEDFPLKTFLKGTAKN
ncbi:MAG: hypothetical protein LBE12_00735 [Planctomycetaceae bacterium]|jgi:hypothetical protein|nr:hypothetical protein [Planctomycetaceae bacterium]